MSICALGFVAACVSRVQDAGGDSEVGTSGAALTDTTGSPGGGRSLPEFKGDEPPLSCEPVCESEAGPCRIPTPCCPEKTWVLFAGKPPDWGAGNLQPNGDSCLQNVTDANDVDEVYEDCQIVENASPPGQCGAPMKGALTCVGNPAGSDFWTLNCQKDGDCPIGMTCRSDGVAFESAAANDFGHCAKQCIIDTDCLRCGLECVDGACTLKRAP